MSKSQVWKVNAWAVVRRRDKVIEPIIFKTREDARKYLKRAVPELIKAFSKFGDKRSVSETIKYLGTQYSISKIKIIL